jgi:hypothetical protein
MYLHIKYREMTDLEIQVEHVLETLASELEAIRNEIKKVVAKLETTPVKQEPAVDEDAVHAEEVRDELNTAFLQVDDDEEDEQEYSWEEEIDYYREMYRDQVY